MLKSCSTKIRKVAIGISGGVDSAVAAILLKRQGYDLIGVTMTLGREDDARQLSEAHSVADQLKIPIFEVNLSSHWRKDVLDYIAATYLEGKTPNPCVRCNQQVKFSRLPAFAFEQLGCDAFATGHYARLECDERGSCILRRGVDRIKDQSYFIYRVAPEVLSRTILPLGEFSKEEIRGIARSEGLTIAEKDDSQDFCGGDVRDILQRSGSPLPGQGDVVNAEGKLLGRHDGFWNYTIGQRKGLGIGGGGIRYYVVDIDPEKNRVVVTSKEDALVRSFEIGEAMWLGPVPRSDESLFVKVRSAGEPKGPVKLKSSADGRSGRCEIDGGIIGVAPGQSAVFYEGDRVRGGGIIA